MLNPNNKREHSDGQIQMVIRSALRINHYRVIAAGGGAQLCMRCQLEIDIDRVYNSFAVIIT